MVNYFAKNYYNHNQRNNFGKISFLGILYCRPKKRRFSFQTWLSLIMGGISPQTWGGGGGGGDSDTFFLLQKCWVNFPDTG